MNIMVLFGSKSCEHEISIITARQIIAAAEGTHRVFAVYIDRTGVWRYIKNFNVDPSCGDADCRHVGRNGRRTSTADDGEHILFSVNGRAADKLPKAAAFPCDKGLYVQKRCGGYKKIVDVDAAIPALHGVNGEDGSVQGLLQLCGIPCVSSGVAASALTMDKILTKETLRGLNIPVLNYGVLKKEDFENGRISFADFFLKESVGSDGSENSGVLQVNENSVTPQVGAGKKTARKKTESRIAKSPPVPPYIVKPASLGSSIGIGIVRDPVGLSEKLAVAFEYDDRVLYETALTDFTEVNVAAYEYCGEILVSLPEKPLSAHELLTFEDKYKTFSKKESKRIFPFEHPLSADIRACAREVYDKINAAGIIRIDFLIDDSTQKYYVNEINSIPGSLAHYLFPEISFPELIDRLIDSALFKARSRNSLQYAYKTDILSLSGKP